MDPILLAFAFAFGLGISFFGLPPLIGFLLAGFAMNAAGFESTDFLQAVADLGVTLLLFTIGLKLDVRSLFKAEVLGASSLHMLATIVFFVLALKLGAWSGLALLLDIDLQTLLLIGFALSFSSTVFAVKVLEAKGELSSFYGRVAIGILIMQDIFAVVFLTLSKGVWPSPWALLLLGLPFIRPALMRLLDRVGHGEVLILFGLFLALVLGAELFYLLGLKADLGALIVGMMVASHPKSGELAKSLFNFKELFLVAFFLNIGLMGLPTWETLGMAFLLLLLLPIKVIIYYACLTLFKLRARTSLFTSLSLANYSEFGLIVAAIGSQSGLLDPSWLVVLALALSLSFVVASPLNHRVDALYQRYSAKLRGFEAAKLHKNDRPLLLSNPQVVIFGMGRIGIGVYESLQSRYEGRIVGIEHDARKVEGHVAQGRNVVLGNATDSDFWEKLNKGNDVELIMLAMPHHQSNLFTAKELQKKEYSGQVGAIVRFNDEVGELKLAGVDSVFNLYEEAGAGFAEHVIRASSKLDNTQSEQKGSTI